MIYGKDVVTRTEALMAALGWQGGTIHQVADFIDCEVNDILYKEVIESNRDYSAGWSAYRTNSLEYNTKHITEGVKGNINFWLGVAGGVQTCIKQGQDAPKKF